MVRLRQVMFGGSGDNTVICDDDGGMCANSKQAGAQRRVCGRNAPLQKISRHPIA